MTEGVEAVNEALRSLPVTGMLFCRAELGSPWGVRSDPLPSAIFHVVLRGSAQLRVDGGEPCGLERGDVALISRGAAHEMEDAPGRDKVSLLALTPLSGGPITRMGAGGDGNQTHLLCGKLHFDEPSAPLLVDLLPACIQARLDDVFLAWLTNTLEMIEAERRSSSAGLDVMVAKLADIVFTQLLRSYLSVPTGEPRGWLAALRDPRLAPAMRSIHHDPGQRWTVDQLAARAAMSRSLFCARFAEVLGEPPARYLNRWRMYQAARELQRSNPGLADLAARLGYDSADAFSRAFKRATGSTPRDFRAAQG